jgi:hypothetical protein
MTRVSIVYFTVETGSIGALQALGLNGISYATYSQIANQKTWDLMLAAAKREKV